jgi:hypothetical protein
VPPHPYSTGRPCSLWAAGQLLTSLDGRGAPGPSGPVRNLPSRYGEDHHAKSTTEGHWTWHLAPVPWERHSSGNRCWSGLLVRRRLSSTELHGR